MKSGYIIPAILLAASSYAYADTEVVVPALIKGGEEVIVVVDNDYTAWAVQGNIVTGGLFGIGLTRYTNSTEMGVTVAGTINDADAETRIFSPAIFGGLRKPLFDNTYFAYGIEAAANFGREDGYKISSDYSVGFYISLEQQLTPNLLLTGWIDPYNYRHQKLDYDCDHHFCFMDDTSVSTHSIFSAGGVALSYFFSVS
jgi:hypothetical protein